MTDRQGRFVLKTREGYATTLGAGSADGLLGGHVASPLKDDAEGLVIKIRPHVSFFKHSGINIPSKEESNRLTTIFGKILFEHVRSGGAKWQSLDGYRRAGIISEEDYAFILAHRQVLLGDQADWGVGWSQLLIVVPSEKEPLSTRPYDLIKPSAKSR